MTIINRIGHHWFSLRNWILLLFLVSILAGCSSYNPNIEQKNRSRTKSAWRKVEPKNREQTAPAPHRDILPTPGNRNGQREIAVRPDPSPARPSKVRSLANRHNRSINTSPAARSFDWKQPGLSFDRKQPGRLPYADHFELLPYLTGEASWYGPQFHGKRTANGEIYNQHGLTAAHPNLPMGTRIRVENLNTGAKVWVRVNDRGPYKKGRILDLSKSAARRLGMIKKGTAPVRITVVKWPHGMDPAQGLKAYKQYVVQVASYQQPGKAESHRRILQSRYQNLDFLIDSTPGGKYTVVAGPYDEESEAQRDSRLLQNEGVSNLVRSLRK